MKGFIVSSHKVFTDLMRLAVFAGVFFASVLFAEEAPDIQPQLIASTKSIVPGKSFLLGVYFKMPEDWHIYWKNPGDAGLATRIRFNLPPGFEAKELLWPVPRVFVQPGGLIGYGYTDEVVLLQEITAPKDLKTGTNDLNAELSWLICGPKLCVPGRAKQTLTLPTGSTPIPDNKALLDRFHARVPPEISSRESPAVIQVEQVAEDPTGVKEYLIKVEWRYLAKNVAWIPARDPARLISNVSVNHEALRTTIKFTTSILPGRMAANGPLESLLVYDDQHGKYTGLRAPISF